MTRKHYIMLAEALREVLQAARDEPDDADKFACIFGIIGAATAIADTLARDNPRFDRYRFLRDAGISTQE